MFKQVGTSMLTAQVNFSVIKGKKNTTRLPSDTHSSVFVAKPGGSFTIQLLPSCHTADETKSNSCVKINCHSVILPSLLNITS